MWKYTGIILTYSGLFIFFFAVLVSNKDLQRLQMVVPVHEAEWRATNEKKEIVELPFVIELKSFTFEEYPSTNKPKSYISEVTVYTQNGEMIDALIKVNHPLSIAGWKIYQYSYDKTHGKMSRYTVFEIVKDPWLPVGYTGICMMLTGVVFLLFSKIKIKFRHPCKVLILILAGIVLFSLFIARMWLSPERTKTLMPALQSPWFLPHVLAYMLAYSVLAVAAIYALFLIIQSKTKKQALSLVLCDNLVFVGTAFLTMGLLFGAIWAKEAWGHYWSWDPKEKWAGATWLAYLFYIHFRLLRPAKMKTAIFLLFFAFLLLQICWVGVKYLPVAKGNSMHVYQ
jgi:ABC-type transport system involved in cytochrome c biogenesis permease subunit